MIQAYFKGKLVIQDNWIKQNEDLKTSSSIGLLQYLPDEVFWEILRDSCADFKTTNFDFGQILSFNFWEHTDATNTTNERLVEPDVWIETENYDVVIEAKVGDASGQSQEQWNNEIQSIKNEQNNNNQTKHIILIALGGNEKMQQGIALGCPVYRVSWYNLMNAVVNERSKQKNNGFVYRILDDVIELFARQGVMRIHWLNTMPIFAIDDNVLALWKVSKRRKNMGFSTISTININETIILQWKPID
jgi:hypothetical protein